VLALDAHPHASAVLGAALKDAPAHAYLLHGPTGSGKREAARAFAAELLAQQAGDPENARVRARHGSHPDLTWVTPSGAHEMLRKDVDESVVAASAHTPFEARHRVFVLERADTMNDEAANALLKTLEEPPAYVVLVLITDKLTQVLPTIASRCQAVRFDPPKPGELALRLQSQGVPPQTAEAAARLSLGDGDKAIALALGDGPALRAAAEAFARAPLASASNGSASGATGAPTAATRPWKTVLDRSRQRGQQAKEDIERALQEELQYLPKKEHKRKETEFTERARRAERRAATQALDHSLQLIGLYYRDLTVHAAGAPELAFHSDRREALEADRGQSTGALQRAQQLVDETRARLVLNVNEELALEALAYRLEETLSSGTASAR
jgi:DNA polymerase III subunit delta'